MARRFGHTWWGRAWISALEDRASLDPNRLPRGRTYARQSRVGRLATVPGSISAAVQGRLHHPYRVDVRFRTFTDAEWDVVVDVIVAKATRAAALLDGELDPGLVQDADAAEVSLLPRAGELQPRCSCPDEADPCKHAAAVCYLVADELDADPFALLLLRGRTRDDLLAAVRRRRASPSAAKADARSEAHDRPPPVIRATQVWSRTPSGLPEVPHPRPGPGAVATWPIDPPSEAPFTAAGLTGTATDATERAWRAITDGASLGLGLTPDQDLARRAAAGIGTNELDTLAQRSGVTPRALARRAIAWRVAGPDGLAALDEPRWRPDRHTMVAAREAVSAVSAEPVRVDGNRLRVGGVQLRLCRDGRWYRFAKQSNVWELDAGPADAPDDLV